MRQGFLPWLSELAQSKAIPGAHLYRKRGACQYAGGQSDQELAVVTVTHPDGERVAVGLRARRAGQQANLLTSFPRNSKLSL